MSSTAYAPRPAPDWFRQFAGTPSVDPVLDARRSRESRPREIEGVTAELEYGSSRWWPYVERRLHELHEVTVQPENEPPVPNAKALRRTPAVAVMFMKATTPTPSVVPTHEGCIQLVWHKGGWDIEVDISDAEDLVWARNRITGASWYGSLEEKLAELERVLDELALIPS